MCYNIPYTIYTLYNKQQNEKINKLCHYIKYIIQTHTHTHTYIYIYIYMSAEDTGSIPRSGRSPGVGTGNPLQYSFFFFKHFSFLTTVFSSGKFHGPRRLVGYSPWGSQIDRTEHITPPNTHI